MGVARAACHETMALGLAIWGSGQCGSCTIMYSMVQRTGAGSDLDFKGQMNPLVVEGR